MCKKGIDNGLGGGARSERYANAWGTIVIRKYQVTKVPKKTKLADWSTTGIKNGSEHSTILHSTIVGSNGKN